MVDLRVESSLRFQLPDPQKNGSLQTTERHIVVVVVALVLTCFDHWNRKRVTCWIAVRCGPLDRRAAWIPQPQKTCDLVERLARRVISSLPQ